MKKIVSLFLTFVLVLSTNFVTAFAIDTPASEKPAELIDALENGRAVEISEGIYKTDDNKYFIDAPVAQPEELVEDDSGIMPRRGTMPSINDVWDWSEGTYYGEYSMSYQYVYTRYRFQGYSSYEVYVDGSRKTEFDPDEDINIDVAVLSGIGTYGKKEQSFNLDEGNYATFIFYGLNTKTRYAFRVGKANDGTTLTGIIRIDGYEE